MPEKKAKVKTGTGAETENLPKGMPYEEGIAQLEALVARMEEGALSLEEMFATYEQGMALHEQLSTLLTQGQRRIEALRTRAGVPDIAEPPILFEDVEISEVEL